MEACDEDAFIHPGLRDETAGVTTQPAAANEPLHDAALLAAQTQVGLTHCSEMLTNPGEDGLTAFDAVHVLSMGKASVPPPEREGVCG